MGKYTDSLNKRLELTHRKDYHREAYQSYMTGPEWRNVEMSDEFAKHLSDNNSYFHFPFFKQTFNLWRVFYQSYRAARQYNSRWQIISSEYFTMDVFVALFTSLELLPKGILSLFIAPFFSKTNTTEMQTHIAQSYQNYADNLQSVPFYEHEYKNIRTGLAEQYKACPNKTWMDRLTWTYTKFELRVRALISIPLKKMFPSPNTDADAVVLIPTTTEVLVKLTLTETPDVEVAKQQALAQLKAIEGVEVFPNDIYVKEPSSAKPNPRVYARVRVPRYAQFVDVLSQMKESNIHLRLIAGQSQVQVKCDANANINPDNPKVKSLYRYGDSLHAQRSITLFDVATRDLEQTVEDLKTNPDVSKVFVHNF